MGLSLVGLLPLPCEGLRYLVVPGAALLGSRLFLEDEHVLCPDQLLLWCPQAHSAPSLYLSFHPNALLNPSGAWAPVLWVSVCLSMAGTVGAGSEGTVLACARPC